MKATRVLDEVKRAHDELEVESALLERKHQRSGLGKHFSHRLGLFSCCFIEQPCYLSVL